jgi:hypothetical protein
MANDNNKEDQQRSQQGSGSAENIGESRDAQKARNTVVGIDERKDIADQTGLKPEDIIDLQDTGALSGRDDAAGGSGDEMTGTSSGDATEKF